MGLLLRRSLLSLISFALVASALPVGMAAAEATQREVTPGNDLVNEVEDDRCVVTERTGYTGEDLNVDLFFSDVTFEDGRIYVNGKEYPQFLVKHFGKAAERLMDDADGNNPDPKPFLNPTLNPILNPLLNALLGPLLKFVEDADPDDLPTIEFEVRVPGPDDMNGARLRVVVFLEVCRQA